MANRDAILQYAEANWYRPCVDGVVIALQRIQIAEQYQRWGLNPGEWKPVFLNYIGGGFKPDGLFFVPREEALLDNLITKEMDARTFSNKRFICSWSDGGPDTLDDGQLSRYWGLNDCAHFLSECLLRGGYSVQTTSAPDLVKKLQEQPIDVAKTLAYMVPAGMAKFGIRSGVMKPGDCIFFANDGGHLHSSLYIGDESIIAHTWSAHPKRKGAAYVKNGHNWEASVNLHHQLVTLIHFSDQDGPPAAETWLHGWWTMTWRGETEYYHFDNRGRCQWSKAAPTGVLQTPFQNPDGKGYWFAVDGKIVVCWTKTGSVETYERAGPDKLNGRYNDTDPIAGSRIS
jgi:hypothetical protein